MAIDHNEKFAAAMGLGPNDMIDYESVAYNMFMAGLQAGREHAQQVPGLARVTNEDDGYLTLQFRDEDAACKFMHEYHPTVESDEVPITR